MGAAAPRAPDPPVGFREGWRRPIGEVQSPYPESSKSSCRSGTWLPDHALEGSQETAPCTTHNSTNRSG